MTFNRVYLPAIGLGITQIMGYGTSMYAYAVLLPHMATDLLALSLQLSGFAVILSAGFTVQCILIAAVIYGKGDGIKTVIRGTLPLALFGHGGYGARLGWIASVSMAVNATAPVVFAWLTQIYDGRWSFVVMALCVAVAFLAYLKIEDPREDPAYDSA